MIKKNTSIKNKLGLHTRAAMQLMRCAERFESTISITYNHRTINAKSILSVMALGAAKGSELTIEANGDDQHAALEAIVSLINNKFGENE